MNVSERCIREEIPELPRSDGEAMTHVSPGFLRAERVEPPSHRDALAQLAEAALVELPIELGLPQQQNLNQLLAAGLEVGQQPNLFERVFGECLGLVDDQEDPASRALLIQ